MLPSFSSENLKFPSPFDGEERGSQSPTPPAPYKGDGVSGCKYLATPIRGGKLWTVAEMKRSKAEAGSRRS